MGKSRRGENSISLPEEDPQALKQRLDETKNKADQLERLLEEKARLDASTMTREEIAARVEEEVSSVWRFPARIEQISEGRGHG